MSKEIEQNITKAIDQTKEWSNTGWNITFGANKSKISSIKDANNLLDAIFIKQEAVSYWITVNETSKLIIKYAEKALKAAEKNDIKSLKDMIYAAQYYAKPYEKYANTWKIIYEKLKDYKIN